MDGVVGLVRHGRAVVILVALSISFSSSFLAILIAAHLTLLAFFQTVISKTTRVRVPNLYRKELKDGFRLKECWLILFIRWSAVFDREWVYAALLI